jgi:putative SOS response-associated peptidase YedK
MKPRKTPKWFALEEDRPLFDFAGLWTPWRGIRGPKSASVKGEHELFGFPTTRG